ncbi:hypothetical protein BYT27DRAFT_7226028 [Phlegmacium glaucopus]|nr:hypothetical protein BYT27DRAFT_7226028 [Phlegmacium glaucopus]
MDEEPLNFEDVSQTVFYIPYNPTDDDSETGPTSQLPSNPLYKARDLENGQELRLAAYRVAWTKCLNKIKEVIEELHNPSVKSVVKEIKSSYLNILPGLPYPELPVVSIINPAFGSTYLNHVTTQLEDLDQIPESTQTIKSFVTHLYPTDFLNIQAGMRSIIAGYVERDDLVPQVKRKPSTSVTNYDINFLIAWYKALGSDADALNLVIVLHDFEQFDPSVMEDVFYICNMHVSQVPIVFVLSLSSPSEHLQITYPRSTLALLRVRNFNVPSGIGILQEILLKVFFNVDFEPAVMIGPVILEYLVDYYTRFNSSTDAILTILQLAHLKHFTSEPLTILVHSTPWNQVLSRPESFSFLDALATRLTIPSSDSTHAMESQDWRSQTLPAIIAEVNRARKSFFAHARNLRIGFRIMMCIQAFLEKQGYKGLEWSADPRKEGGLCEAMVNVLRGKLGGDIKRLGTFTKMLKPDELQGILEELRTFFEVPSEKNLDEQEALTNIALFQSLLSGDSHDKSNVQMYSDVANRLSEWTKTFLTDKLVLLEDTDLWDIWYTGASPFPAELINPSIRASLLSGLLRPHDYADSPFDDVSTNATSKSLWELPDTSILFKRYLDSGKMINVYDWFESFQTILETQRTELKARSANDGRTSSPSKRGKMKQPPPETEEALERWKIEVHARFIRALHELDYLGFIKHTKRKTKADHVLRTLFDVADDGFDE